MFTCMCMREGVCIYVCGVLVCVGACAVYSTRPSCPFREPAILSNDPISLTASPSASTLPLPSPPPQTPMSLLGGIGSGIAVGGTLLYSLTKKKYSGAAH